MTGKATLEKGNPGSDLRSANLQSQVKASVLHLLISLLKTPNQSLK